MSSADNSTIPCGRSWRSYSYPPTWASPPSISLIERVRAEASSRNLKEAEEVVDLLKAELVALLSAADGASGREQSHTPGQPRVILAIGVNGVGKTTSIAKLAHYLTEQGSRVLLAASDTFRAGAIEQLQSWGGRIGVDVIAHRAGGDPAAIAYDALEAARARGMDAVIVDTAGRLHTKQNLMEEMKKISRVLSRLDPQAPHETILVMDATTGQNGVIQARSFTEAMGCTGVFLSKLDGTAKGGTVVAIVQELGLPVLFIGTGEGMDDMAPFHAAEFVEELFSPVG